MNFWDYFYIVAMPIGWLTSILDTRKIIQTRSARSRSVSAYGIALILMSTTLFRALFSVNDFLFWLNASVFMELNGFQFGCIVRWRKQ